MDFLKVMFRTRGRGKTGNDGTTAQERWCNINIPQKEGRSNQLLFCFVFSFPLEQWLGTFTLTSVLSLIWLEQMATDKNSTFQQWHPPLCHAPPGRGLTFFWRKSRRLPCTELWAPWGWLRVGRRCSCETAGEASVWGNARSRGRIYTCLIKEFQISKSI